MFYLFDCLRICDRECIEDVEPIALPLNQTTAPSLSQSHLSPLPISTPLSKHSLAPPCLPGPNALSGDNILERCRCLRTSAFQQRCPNIMGKHMTDVCGCVCLCVSVCSTTAGDRFCQRSPI